MQLMDEFSKNNRAWKTRDAEVGDLGFTFELSAEQKKREEERDQDMAHTTTQMDLLTKHIMTFSEKGVSRIITRETKVIILEIKVGAIQERGNMKDLEIENKATGNRDRPSGSSSGSKIEDMLAKVLQMFESIDIGVKDMTIDFFGMSQLVDSHTTSIKQLEQ
ncbi:hypothetical protein KY290_024839 [Solanum tuberosum]|uniref:Integrase core domain containing protein n=1 Tax=Solanum tuberosum TaxID=4113 RepID=A0ABQ7UTM3_SOLTU|nr:hypothetical protein KY290_024839 [Solanum tuberosum]